MKKEWVKLKTAVNMAAAMEVLTQSFTFKFLLHLNQLSRITYLDFPCQQKQQPSYINITNIGN